MSGGFFRGTSADQDTRFSNKQAKLLKSQKFPPELDHLVDMTKVKMDVIRPWIATRVTELLGFEDEVLINFVYGLLDAKEVDGKKIQIQLTGFMEKNTGKFMKELWGLLLSAQNNVSGVPQQFLDAKEEETKKKKAETDRIAQEIQKRRDRDGREPERERKSRFDGEAEGSKFTKSASNSVSKFSGPRDSDVQPEADREVDGGHASRAKNGDSRSSPSNDRSPSPRIVPSPIRSYNKSISGSRSYSEERRKSRSLSVSSQSLRRSVSPKRRYQSPERRSLSPTSRHRSSLRRSISPHRRQSPQRIRSPVRRRSPHPRRRSRSRHRSPSPYRYRSPRARRRSPRRISRSPLRRRSPSPLRRRSPSPFRRRSPARRRSSPRRRSPSPSRHRSPLKARRRSPSPVRRRSLIKNRSLSPERVRSPSPGRRSPPSRSPRRRQGSPFHSPKNHPADSPTSPPQRKRSPSPYRSQSPSRRSRRSLSREHDGRANGIKSRWYREEQFPGRTATKDSPANHSPERELSERPGSKHKPSSHRVPISLRSPQRDVGNQSGSRKKMPVLSPENSPHNSESPTDVWKLNPRARRSLSKSPVRQTNTKVLQHDSPGKSKEHITRAREVSRHRTDSSRRSKDSPRELSPESSSPDRRESSRSPASPGSPPHSELKKRDSRRERDRQQSVKPLKSDLPSDKTEREQVVGDEMRDRQGGGENNELCRETGSTTTSKRKMDKKIRDTRDSDSEDTSSYKNENSEKRRHKKSDKRKRDYDETSESDSQIEDKKKSKRRRKDEKRLRKEERRRRREERHLRKLERRAGKMKVKSVDTVSPPSDVEMKRDDSGDSDRGASRRKNLHSTDVDENESEQKRLEIELREKALESLRAKKAISH